LAATKPGRTQFLSLPLILQQEKLRTMRRIYKAVAKVLAPSLGSGLELQLPAPWAPDEIITVELNAADPEGFAIGDFPLGIFLTGESLTDVDLAHARTYVRALFEAADIDPKAELVKLRDAGCTFGGVPVPHAVDE